MTTKKLRDAERRPPIVKVKGYVDQRGQLWHEVRRGRQKVLLHERDLIDRAAMFRLLADRGLSI